MLNSSQLLPPIPNSATVVTFSIKVNGTLIPDNFAVHSVESHYSFNRIPYAKILLRDSGVAEGKLVISDQDTLSPGNEIEIQVGYDSREDIIFKGLIIRHRVKIKEYNSSYVEIECKDQAVRTTVERKNRYFLGSSDQEIIESVVRNYTSLSSDVEATDPTYPEMVQYHATDWDFILTRAESSALLVRCWEGKIIAKRPVFDGETKYVINYGSSLYEFEAEMDARDQYPLAKAISWDYSKQELLEVEADAEGASSIGGIGGGLGAVAGAARVVAGAVGISLPGAPPNTDYRNSLGVTGKTLQHAGNLTQPELENWANTQYQKSQLAKQRGYVRHAGIADVHPGDTIEIQGVGLRHAGKVLVTAVHQQIKNGRWDTRLRFGLSPEWFTETYPDIHSQPTGGLLPGIEGLQIGVVTRLEGDPEEQDRIQVRLPLVSDNGEGLWVRQASMDAGQQRGAFFRPEIMDEVVVGFINNDPRQAIVLGMLYSGGRAAPLETTDDNHEKGWVTRSGMKMLFNDEISSFTLETPGGNKLVIDDDAKSITLEDQHGNKIVTDQGGITIESAKDINIKAAGDVNIEGANVNAKAKSGFTAEGNSTATLKSQAQTVIEGGIVQIN